MDDIIRYFPVILYLLGSVLLVILIILSLKLIKTIDKTNEILEDAYNKTRSLDGLFNAIDAVTDALTSMSDSIVMNLTNIIGKIFHKNKRKKEDKENE